MKTSTVRAILLLLAMGLVVLPAPLEAACGMIAHPDLDPCETCPADSCKDPACDQEAGHADEDCCDTGCQHCSLPCCSGTAMIPVASQQANPMASADGCTALFHPDATWVDSDPLYHPPRA